MTKDRLSETVFGALKDDILLNRLRPGDCISEKALVSKFNVSRTPVRQALQRLEALNLVRVKDGVGTFVTMIDQNDMADAYQIRQAIEKVAIQTSIYHITAKELDELEDTFLRFQRQLVNGGYGAKFEEITYADWKLHDLIVNRSDNKLLGPTVERITLLLRRYQMTYISGYARATSEHLEIISGIREQDVGQVQQVLTQHLNFRPI